MKKLGVQVIIPDPVIVEPPYILSMGLHSENGADAIIGVLGLPEMVINTLLLSTIKTDCELKFRIASNAFLDDRNKKDLEYIFNFKDTEKKDLQSLNLDIEKTYQKEEIATNFESACFCATALTDDDILKLEGLKIKNSTVKLETIFSGINGYILKLITTHLIDF